MLSKTVSITLTGTVDEDQYQDLRNQGYSDEEIIGRLRRYLTFSITHTVLSDIEIDSILRNYKVEEV